MPEIAVAPLPVAPAPSQGVKSPTPGANAANGADSSDASQAADGGSKDPFAAVLQRMVKNGNSQGDATADKTATEPLAGMAAGAASGVEGAATPADLMAQILAQMGQLAQDGSGKRKGSADTKDTDDDSAGTAVPLAAPTPAVTASVLPDQAQADKGGSDVSALAARPAILATDQSLGDGGKHAGADEGAADFHELLTAATQTAQHVTTEKLPESHGPRLEVQTPVGHQNWSQEVGDKLTWIANKQESKAELVLNPPHMGRVEVSITLNGDQASASFVSANPAVRDALESALPRLREVLADAGVRLDQAQVGADNRGNSAQDQERRDNRGHDKNVTGEFIPGLATTASSSGNWTRRGNGLVDTFV